MYFYIPDFFDKVRMDLHTYTIILSTYIFRYLKIKNILQNVFTARTKLKYLYNIDRCSELSIRSFWI